MRSSAKRGVLSPQHTIQTGRPLGGQTGRPAAHLSAYAVITHSVPKLGSHLLYAISTSRSTVAMGSQAAGLADSASLQRAESFTRYRRGRAMVHDNLHTSSRRGRLARVRHKPYHGCYVQATNRQTLSAPRPDVMVQLYTKSPAAVMHLVALGGNRIPRIPGPPAGPIAAAPARQIHALDHSRRRKELQCAR